MDVYVVMGRNSYDWPDLLGVYESEKEARGAIDRRVQAYWAKGPREVTFFEDYEVIRKVLGSELEISGWQ